MSLMVDPSLNWVFYIIAGDAWPQGDEDKARELAAEWDQVAQEISAAGTGFSQLAEQVVSNVGGEVATNFADYANKLSTMGAGFSYRAQQQAAALREYALNVENAKYGILISIAVTAADLIWAMTNPFTAPLIPGIWAAGRTAVMQIERSLMSRLMSLLSRVAREAAQEAAEEAAEEMLAEFIQIAQGNRDGFDWKQIGQNAALGAIGGAFAAGAHSGLGKWGHNVFGAAGVEAATEVVVGLAGAGLFGGDLDSLGWGALNGGLSGAATHGAHHAGQNLHDKLTGGGGGGEGKGPNDPGGENGTGNIKVDPVNGPNGLGGSGDPRGLGPGDSGGSGPGGSGPGGSNGSGPHGSGGTGPGGAGPGGSNSSGSHGSDGTGPGGTGSGGTGLGGTNSSDPHGSGGSGSRGSGPGDANAPGNSGPGGANSSSNSGNNAPHSDGQNNSTSPDTNSASNSPGSQNSPNGSTTGGASNSAPGTPNPTPDAHSTNGNPSTGDPATNSSSANASHTPTSPGANSPSTGDPNSANNAPHSDPTTSNAPANGSASNPAPQSPGSNPAGSSGSTNDNTPATGSTPPSSGPSTGNQGGSNTTSPTPDQNPGTNGGHNTGPGTSAGNPSTSPDANAGNPSTSSNTGAGNPNTNPDANAGNPSTGPNAGTGNPSINPGTNSAPNPGANTGPGTNPSPSTITNPGTSTSPSPGTNPGASTNPPSGANTNPSTSPNPGANTNPSGSTSPSTSTNTSPGSTPANQGTNGADHHAAPPPSTPDSVKTGTPTPPPSTPTPAGPRDSTPSTPDSPANPATSPSPSGHPVSPPATGATHTPTPHHDTGLPGFGGQNASPHSVTDTSQANGSSNPTPRPGPDTAPDPSGHTGPVPSTNASSSSSPGPNVTASPAPSAQHGPETNSSPDSVRTPNTSPSSTSTNPDPATAQQTKPVPPPTSTSVKGIDSTPSPSPKTTVDGSNPATEPSPVRTSVTGPTTGNLNPATNPGSSTDPNPAAKPVSSPAPGPEPTTKPSPTPDPSPTADPSAHSNPATNPSPSPAPRPDLAAKPSPAADLNLTPSPNPNVTPNPGTDSHPATNSDPSPATKPSPATNPNNAGNLGTRTNPHPATNPSPTTHPDPAANPSPATRPDPASNPNLAPSPGPNLTTNPDPKTGTNPAAEPSSRPNAPGSPSPDRSANPTGDPVTDSSPNPPAKPASEPKPSANPVPAVNPRAATSPKPGSDSTSSAKPQPTPDDANNNQPPNPAKPIGTKPTPAPRSRDNTTPRRDLHTPVAAPKKPATTPQSSNLHTPVAAPKKPTPAAGPGPNVGKQPPITGGKGDFAQHLKNFKFTVVHETGIIGNLGTRNENNQDSIGVVATVAATPDDNLQAIAEKYAGGFTGNSADGRFGLVIGINGTPGSEQAINQKIQQFQNTWDNRFPVAIIGFTWKHPSNPNIDQKTIPYGGIRETMVRNPVTEQLVGQIREAGGTNEVYLHTGDADVHSLNTRTGPLFDAVNTVVQQNPEGPPEVISGGYNVRPEDGDLANRAAQLDLDVRQALAGVDSRAVYFPEPNTFVRMEGNKLENDATFGTKNPNTGNFDYGAKEGQGLIDSVLSQRNPSWQYSDHPTAIAKFSSDLAIQTNGTRIASKVGTDPNGITALTQSHANETTWSDLLGHYLGNHTTLDPNLAKIAAKAAFHGITPSGPNPNRPEVFSEVVANLPKNERTSLVKGMKENVEDGKKLADLTLATRQALVDNLSGNRPATTQTPAAAPKNNGQAKETPKPNPKTLPGPKDWNGRRDTAPVTRFSSERFDPIKKIAGQFTGNRDGLKGGQLAGAMAHIRFDVRRFEIAPGQWVREHTIPIDLTSHSGSVTPQQREQFVQDLRQHLEDWVNQSSRLPGGDQLHLRLDVRVTDDIHPDDTGWQADPSRRVPVNVHDSTVDPDTPDTNQLNWDVHDSPFGVTHELMHFIGLGDGYKNDEILFNRQDQPGVMGPDAWHDSRLNPGNLAQIEQVSNTANIRDHHLGDAPAPNPTPHQDDHRSEPDPDGRPNLHTPIKAPQPDSQTPNQDHAQPGPDHNAPTNTAEQNQNQQDAVLVADEQSEEEPDTRPLADRLPEFVRDGKALGSVVPVDVRGAKDVGTSIENLIQRLNPKQQNPPQIHGIDAITDSLSGPEFESFMGDGRKQMVRAGEKWYEVHVTAEPDFSSVNADQITKLPQPTIGDVKNEVKTTHASPNTDTTAKVVGSSYFALFPAGPYASVGGTAQLASPSAEHTGTTTGTDQRVIRTAGDMQRADAPVTYRITVRNETGGLVGSTVDGQVGLVLSTDLSNLKQEPTVGPAEPKPDWAKKIEFLSPEAVDFDENALFDQVSKNLHPSVTKFGAPGRTSLREFLSRGGVRSMLGTAMQGSPVVSNDLLSPHGAHRDAVQLAARPTKVEYLGTIPGDSELRFNDSSVNGGSTTVSSKYGGEVNAIFGGGSYVPGTVGGVGGVSGSYSRKVNQQSTSGTSYTNKSTVNAKGDIGLYKVTVDLEVTTSTGETTTIQATSYTRMGLPEAKAQGLPVPKNTSPKFKDVGARYEPPYLAAAMAAGTARPGSFEPATRVQPQIENALRNLPGADKFLPRWDKFQGDNQGSSRDISERFANLRKIASTFSVASLRGKMDSLFTQGVSAQLKRRGLFTDEYINVTVKAKPGPGRHLGQADGRSVKNSNETSPSLTSATTTERGWSVGLEGRVIIPGASAGANLGISPTVSPLQYSDNRTWKNSGGPTVTTTTGKGGSPDSQVFEHDVEFEVEITSYTRHRPWVRRLTPGSPFRVTPKVSTVAKTGDPGLPKIGGKVDLWINDGAALAKDPAEFTPGKPGVVSMSPNETPSIDDLLTQQQNQTPPKFLHVEAFANTEALRDEALRQLQRAAGGDAVLGLPGSEARARVDRMFSPENFRGLTPKLLKQGGTANGFRYDRRVADRVGGLGVGVSLSNPKLVAVSETGGGDRTFSGGSKASYEGTHKQSIEANVQLGLTIRPPGSDTHGQGQFFGTAKWSPWQRSSGSSQEITASVDHTNRSSSDSRTVLVQYDSNVRLIAESRQEGLVNGSISRAGADVHLPGSVFVAMTEDEARAEGLLPPVEPRTPAPGKLSAPPLVGGKSSSLGSAVLEDAPNLTKLVQDARQQLGKLGDRLLPKSVLNDSMNNLQRTLDTASPEAVTSLVDSALDGGVSLLAQDAGVLWTDNYQLQLKAKILDTQFLGVKHDGSEVDHVVNSTQTDKKNSGHGSSYGGQVRGAGRGLFQDSQPKVSGYDGAYLGATGTRAKTDQTVEAKTTTTALTSSSSGPSARYQHQVQFELVVARDGRTYPVASQEATVTSRSSADDHRISGDEQYHTKLYGSRTTELSAAESTPDRLEAWQQEGFGALPKSSTVEGIRGAADVRAGAIRALRLAGAGNGLTRPGTGAHNTLSSSITNETLQAHLPNMVGKPFATPDLHSSAVTGSSHASVKVYTRVVKPDLTGLSDSVKLERSDQSGSTFTGEAKETVTGEQQGNIGTGGITDPGRNTHAWGGLDVRGPVGQSDPTSSTAAAQRSVVGKDKGRTGLVGFDVEYRIVATVDGKTAAVEVRVPQSSRTRMSETDLEQSLGQPLPETLTSAQDAVKKAAEDWRTAEEELEKAQRDYDDAWLSENDNVRTTTDGARGLHLPADGNPVQQMRQAVQTAQNEARDVGQALRAGNDEITRLNELDEQLLSLALGEEPGSVEQSDLVARAWDAQRQVQQIRNEQANLVQQRQAAQDRAAEILAVLDEYRNNHTDHTARQDDAANRIQEARDKADEALRKWWQAKSEVDSQLNAHTWPRPAENTVEEHREGTVEANDTVSGWDTDTDRPYSFDPHDIQVRQITDASGRVRAVSFLPANEHTESVERDWVASNSGTVSTLPEGATPEKFDPLLKQANANGATPELSGRRFGEWADHTAAPWDDDSLFVFAHGREQSVKVTLLGGKTVRVDGDTFARIVAQAAPLAQSHSVTLIACSTGQTDGPGGLAHDFQRALSELGGPSTVHAPTKPALFGRDSATLGKAIGAKDSFTAVTDGGHFHTFGDPSVQSTTDSAPPVEETRYSSPEDLVADLRQTAVNGPAPAPLLGPDLFGLYRAPEPPEFLRGHDFRTLTAGQGISFLDLLDLAKGYQLSSEHFDPANLDDNRDWTLEKERPDEKLSTWAPGNVEPLAKTTSTPLLMHSIWLGGPLKDTGTMHAFRRNFGDAADRLGDGIVPVLWTDVPRWQTELALTTTAPEEGPDPLHDVRDLLRWAGEHRVQLVNVDEVFTSEHPMRTQEFYLSEVAKQTGPGFAAASDILRLELMHRFGGLYTDGDNVVHGLDDVVRAAESDAGYAVHRVGGNIANSAFTMSKGHPFASSYLDQLRDNYGQTQANLMPREVDSLGQGFFATPMGRVHRQSVMYRSGPVAMTETARRIGLSSALELPGMTEIRMNSDHSWLLPPQGDPAPLADRFETLELTQRVIQTLVRGLHNRDGDLHLTAVEPAVRRHADPDLVWHAALSYIAANPELSALVRTVTDRSSYTGKVHDVPLPPDARALLTIDDSRVHYHLGEVQRGATMQAADAVLVADTPLDNLISRLRSTDGPVPPVEVTGTGPDGRALATAAARELAGKLADALGSDVLDRVPVKIRVSEGDGQVRIAFGPGMSTGTPTPRVFRGLDDSPAPATPRPWTPDGRTVGVHYGPSDVSVPNGSSFLTTDATAIRNFTEQLRIDGTDRPADAVRLPAAEHPTADYLLSDTPDADLMLEELVRTATHRWWFRPTPPTGPIPLSDRDGTAKLLGWVLAELGRGESAAALAEDVARHERPDLIWTAARELAALSPRHTDLAEQHAVLHLHGVTDTLLGKPDAAGVLSDLAQATRDGADVTRIAEAVEVLERHGTLDAVLSAPGGRTLLLEELTRLADRPNPDGYARDLAAVIRKLAAKDLSAAAFRTALRNALDGPRTRPRPHRLSVVGLGWLDRWHTAAAIRRYQAEERAASARQAAELAELAEGSPSHE
ncbi:WXG100-like domain-containing protein [Amycolatopsis sp. VC5-11]|uniref:WXG100-like domain-containing protein n=1 Tax=Amycolatopsis sp. VC5-11 TaxID=3120156 RepID=UPI0030099B4B